MANQNYFGVRFERFGFSPSVLVGLDEQPKILYPYNPAFMKVRIHLNEEDKTFQLVSAVNVKHFANVKFTPMLFDQFDDDSIRKALRDMQHYADLLINNEPI